VALALARPARAAAGPAVHLRPAVGSAASAAQGEAVVGVSCPRARQSVTGALELASLAR
jgi:hypothetical protein